MNDRKNSRLRDNCLLANWPEFQRLPILERLLGTCWLDDPLRVRFEQARSHYELAVDRERPARMPRQGDRAGAAVIADASTTAEDEAYTRKIAELDAADKQMLLRLQACVTDEEMGAVYIEAAERFERIGGIGPPVDERKKEVRGHDREPRRRKVRPAPQPSITDVEKRARAVRRRIDKIVRLLRRHDDGLSENEIRQALKAGRTETSKALSRAVTDGRVVSKGSLTNPRYYAAKEVIRK